MKDFSLAVILFFSIVMRAQNPLPTFSRFIGPGTAWNMVTVPYGFEQEEKPSWHACFYNYVNGDTIVNDTTYWKVYAVCMNWRTYYTREPGWGTTGTNNAMLYREDEQGRIWYRTRLGYNVMLFDFGKPFEVGDTLRYAVGDNRQKEGWRLHEEKVTEVSHIVLENGEVCPIANNRIIYGIGSIELGPDELWGNEHSESTYYHFLDFYRNGELLYEDKAYKEKVIDYIERMQEKTSVKLSTGNRLKDNTIYDLSGRRTDGKKPGVYIKNGKKVVMK